MRNRVFPADIEDATSVQEGTIPPPAQQRTNDDTSRLTSDVLLRALGMTPQSSRWTDISAFLALIMLIYHATIVLRVSLWFRSASWQPHETTSALYAICHNRTCTTKPDGPTEGLANMHVYGALARRPTTTADILHNTMIDGVDAGKSNETHMWYWFLRHQTDLKSKRYVPSLLTNVGLSVCLTKACTNPVYYRIGDILYSTTGSYRSIGAYNVHDRVCYTIFRVDPMATSLPSTVVVQLSGGIAGTENIYTMLMNEIGGEPSTSKMTFLAMRDHFKCVDPVDGGGHLVYHGLDAGRVLAPPQFTTWKGVVMDTAYATGTCNALDMNSQFRFAFTGTNVPTDRPFTWQLSATNYGGVVSDWRNGSLLPGYESIVDSRKLVNYIKKCDNLQEFFLKWPLNVSLTDVRTSVPVMAYAFKNITMGRILPANYTNYRYRGGLQLVVEDPAASPAVSSFLQSSFVMVFGRNSDTRNTMSGSTIQDTAPSVTGGLSYLEFDILTGIYGFPGMEVLVRKLLNSTMLDVQKDFCNAYSTFMHDYRGEVNKTQTYATVCNEMFTAYEEWKKDNGGAPPQPVRDNLPTTYPFMYFNNDPTYSSTDLELASAIFTSVDKGNLVPITQGLLSLRFGFRGFNVKLNTTHGTMVQEDQPRVFVVNSKFPVSAFCKKTDKSYFYAPNTRKYGKVVAVIAAAVISIAVLPALYVFCFHSTVLDRGVFRILDVADITMTLCMGVLPNRTALLVFSCCSSFVSRARPEDSWDPWYANTSLGIELNWLSWLVTASSSGAYLYGMACFAQDFGLSKAFPLRGIAMPALINVLVPLACFIVDWFRCSNISEYDDDWAAMPSALTLGVIELAFAAIVFALVLIFYAWLDCKRKTRTRVVVGFEPYRNIAVCIASSRTHENGGRVPGWVLTLGGYRWIQRKGVDYISRAGFMSEVKDGKVMGDYRAAQGNDFRGRPVTMSLLLGRIRSTCRHCGKR